MDAGTDAQQLASQVDKLLGRLDAMLDHFERPANTNSMVHTSTMGGVAVWTAATAAIAALAVMFGMIIFESRSYAHLDAQVDQLRAWNDVHSKEIARLQAALSEKK